MSNIEFLRAPIYISASNMVLPLATIKLETVFTNVLTNTIWLLNIIQIGIQTACFIMKELFIEAFAKASPIWKNLTIEKIIYMLVVYNLLILVAMDKQRRKAEEQKEVIESLNKEVSYLKKTERMREDLDELWLQDVRRYHQETNNKITAMEKKIKKMEKEIKIYE